MLAASDDKPVPIFTINVCAEKNSASGLFPDIFSSRSTACEIINV